MPESASHLGTFHDWVELARRSHRLFDAGGRGPDPERLRAVLGLLAPPEDMRVREGRTWRRDGVDGREVSWWPGFGPRTRAWVLRPAGAAEPLPGILALHCHAGTKHIGRERLADGPDGPAPTAVGLRGGLYADRAVADDLARQGFTVLCHDAFSWGSRGFEAAAMPERVLRDAEAELAARPGPPPGTAERYDAAARHHEHTLAKYCTLLGSSLAGMVAREDLLALDHLAARPDVRADAIGCMGLSGGGWRATLLHALDDRIGAGVVVAMMSTFAQLSARHVDPHTWMLFPAGLSRECDWPELAATRAPAPLLVQYAEQDHLFTPEGMRGADAVLRARYAAARHPSAYKGSFHPGGHALSAPMQREAAEWLHEHLG